MANVIYSYPSMVRDLLLLATKGHDIRLCVTRVMLWPMKVRITETPREYEVDGVHLDGLARGSIREVSPSIGSWLILQGYAEPEMRQSSREENQDLSGGSRVRDTALDRPHRLWTD
jgi:hypothetical protein